MNALNSRSGFTIIEALVAMLLLSSAIIGAQLLVTSMKLNVSSGSQLQVNQAAQRYLEAVQGDWRVIDRYGKLDASSARPPELPGHQWRVRTCEVNLSDGTCTNQAQISATTTGSHAATAGTQLVRLTVDYTRVTSGRITTVSTEVARP